MDKLFADNQQKVIATIQSWGKASSVPDRTIKRIVARLLPSIRLVPKKGGTAQKGSSRIGGMPDLPEGALWPRVNPKDEGSPPMSFVMQISLAEVAGVDTDKVLPAEGLLSLFYYWDDDGGEDEGRVLFFPAPVPALARLKAPADLEEEARYRAFSLRPQPEWTLPSLSALGLWDDMDLELWFALGEQMTEAQGLAGVGLVHRMLGHPDISSWATYRAVRCCSSRPTPTTRTRTDRASRGAMAAGCIATCPGRNCAPGNSIKHRSCWIWLDGLTSRTRCASAPRR